MVNLPQFTRRQWATAAVIAFADFCSAVCVSLQAPFYPAEAERKGATASEYGLVFGIFELTVFLTSPLFGKYVTKLVPKSMLTAGLFVTGFCSILFGVIDKVESKEAFITLSFTIRVVEALGNAAFLTACFTTVAAEFPASIATTFACLETFFGLGLIVGPTLGGLLFQIGGYILPFAVLGGVLILASCLTHFLLPDCYYPDVPHGDGLLKILRIPSILLASFSVFCASIAIGFLSATLEPHLRQFNLSPIVMGLMFVIEGGVYAITAPLWGLLCDRKCRPKIVTLAGALFLAGGFIFVGPAPFIPHETTLPLAITGLVVLGVGIGAELVSGFIAAFREATFHGFPNNLATYGLVSGMWTSTFALGAFIGPSVAGILFDNFGFRNGTLFVIVTNLMLAFSVVVFLFIEYLWPNGSPSYFASKRQEPLQQQQPNYSTITSVNDPKMDSTQSSLKQKLLVPEWTLATNENQQLSNSVI